jgi:glycosyltransferase involved in cell wall biosynthesis
MFLYIASPLRIRRLAAPSSIDLVHAHFVSEAMPLLAAGISRTVPVVVTAHGADATMFPRTRGLSGYLCRHIVRSTLRRAERIIAVSEFIRESLLPYAPVGATISVLHIGIPIPVAPSPVIAKEWDVVFVGRLVEKKGVVDLLGAISALRNSATIRVAIAGAGPLRASLEVLAKQLGIKVAFMGHQTPQQVTHLLAGGHVFVGPSRTSHNGDSEGFGMVFLEAAAACLPVVAYQHGGVPEAVEDGVTGLLAPEGDVASLAAKIQYLLDNPDAARAMGLRGRERVERDFDIVKQSARLEELYDEAVEQYRQRNRVARQQR